MSPNEEEIIECFNNEDEYFMAQHGSYHAYTKNMKSCDVISFGKDQKMKLSSKSSSTVSRVGKKTKFIWTKDLHKKFLEAIGKLGIDNAVPKKIVELMKVDGLTRDQVASHLQKYRILSKKIANANYDVQTALKPCLLESSLINNGASWNNTSLMLNQEQINSPYFSGMHAISPLTLDTSSSCFPVLEASNFNPTNSGYSLQAMTKNLNQERNFINDTTNFSGLNLVNSSKSGFVQNLDGNLYDYGGYPTEVQKYNSFEMDSSGGSVQNSSNSSFVQNPNGFNNNYSNNYLGNRLGEDDLKLNEVDIAYLLSYVNDNNLPVNLDPSIQDMSAQNITNNVSSCSDRNEEPIISVNQHQSLDGYLPGFDPTFKQMDERFMEPIWSPEPFVDDMTLHNLILNS